MSEAAHTDDVASGPNNRFIQPPTRYFLTVVITAIERTARKDPIIRFDAKTNLPGFRTTQFRDIRRTHHEFRKLADHLTIQNPECIVPALFPNTTSFGAGTDEDTKRLKHNLQYWLTMICDNAILVRDKEIMHFVESDFGWSPVMSKGRPASGIRRKAIKQLQPPPDECDELVKARPVAKQFHLLSADCSRRLHRVIKVRVALSSAEQDLAQRIGALIQAEHHPGLMNAFEKLGRTLQAVSDNHSVHATLEAGTLGDALDYHSENAFVVKETLTTRQLTIRELNQAQNASRSRQNNASRMKSSSNLQSSKVDEALTSLEEAKALEQHLTSKLDRMTANLMIENRSWQQRTGREVHQALREYASRQIDSERRILTILESVRPDIRAIDSSGGLSRLGRTNLQRTRSSAIPSQTSDGDAWSGVKRIVKVPQDGPAAAVSDNGASSALSDGPQQHTTVNAKTAASLLSVAP